jgi:hypothetical protein
MTERPEPVVVRTAATPNEAKVLVALLQAEGIPAQVDSDWLVDEFIMSRKLMNMNGVKVFVPADAAARAREILQAAAVDEDELTAQALAAAPDPAAVPAPARFPRRRIAAPPWLTLAFAVLAFVFLALWLGKAGLPSDPVFEYGLDGDRLIARFRATGLPRSESHDRDRDGHFEEVRFFDDEGRLLCVCFDDDRDGYFELQREFGAGGELCLEAYDRDGDGVSEEIVEQRAGGLRARWRDADGDRLHELCTITDAGGRELRRQHWDGERGWVDAR